jgi:uncharacterized membrane protein YdbT with pleckstrin-like domain
MEDSNINEKIIWEGSQSQILNIPSFLFALALAAVIIILAFITPPPTGMLLLFLLIIPVFYAFWKWIQVHFIRYRITDQRFLCITGIFSKKTDTIELYRVRDLELFEPFLYRLFGKGIIKMVTIDTITPSFIIKAIPDPKDLFNKLRVAVEHRRDIKRVRGVEFEQFDETI